MAQLTKDQYRALFQWADNQAAKHGLTLFQREVLRTFIACCDDKLTTHITRENLHKKLKSKLGASVQSLSTVGNSISRFSELKLIKRDPQKGFKKPVKTRVLAPMPEFSQKNVVVKNCNHNIIFTTRGVSMIERDTTPIGSTHVQTTSELEPCSDLPDAPSSSPSGFAPGSSGAGGAFTPADRVMELRAAGYSLRDAMMRVMREQSAKLKSD